MTTQEKLEAFGPYLPYEIKCYGMGEWIEGTEYNDKPTPKMFRIVGIVKDSNEEYYAQCEENNGDITDIYVAEDLFPILHPISDLTKPCLEGGKAPINELSRLFGGHDFVKNSKDLILELDGAIRINILDFPLKFIQQLYKWHFWLGDQSEFRKSIIDINTIKNE